MKKSTLVLFSLFPVFTATAQEVVSSQGESYSNSGGSINFDLAIEITNYGIPLCFHGFYSPKKYNYLKPLRIQKKGILQ